MGWRGRFVPGPWKNPTILLHSTLAPLHTRTRACSACACILYYYSRKRAPPSPHSNCISLSMLGSVLCEHNNRKTNCLHILKLWFARQPRTQRACHWQLKPTVTPSGSGYREYSSLVKSLASGRRCPADQSVEIIFRSRLVHKCL